MIQALALALMLAPDVQSSPQEFVTRYRARDQSIQTEMVRSTWEDFENGKPTRRDQQTIYLDALGRRRLQMQVEQLQEDGTWVPYEQLPYEGDQLFDGSLTALMVFDPRKDRVGSTPKEGVKPSGYRLAQIFDGDEHVGRNHRVPLAFVDGYVTVLESALRNKIPIEVINETEQQVAFGFTDDRHGQFLRFEADKTRDWVPVMIRVDQSGKFISRYDLEYAATDSGFWYPKKGTYRYYAESEQEAPQRESRFEVTECRINDPDFDEGIFKIVLYPDTAVSDLRYKVSYRIGTENTYTTQLAALAKSALDSQKANPDGLGERVPLTPPRGGRGRWILVWVNVAILAAIIAFVVGRRWMAK